MTSVFCFFACFWPLYASFPWSVQPRPSFRAIADLTLLQIFFAFRAVKQPSSIPISLAALHLMKEASDNFMNHVSTLLSDTGNFSDQLLNLRKLFEAGNIANKIVDGTTPFPENQQSIRHGISLEFRYRICRPTSLQGIDLNEISSGMCRSNIMEVKLMLCAIFPLELSKANFA